ncbi:MAG: hypothetical protein DRJ38_05555 [Thermoprotei archaeon]|nr:MAG: hypothetical protein DRJ38_05555 [Thermoprotei archaeon]
METIQYSYPSEKPRKGIFELLSIAILFFKNRPALSVPALISLSSYIIQSSLLILVLLYMTENVFEIDVLREIIKKGEIGLMPELLNYLLFFIKFYAITFIITKILSRALYSTFFYPYAYKLFKGESISFFGQVRESFKYFGKMLRAALVVEGIATGLPILIFIFTLDSFLKMMQLEELISPKFPWSIENIAIVLSLLLIFLLLIGIALIFEFLFIFVFQIMVVEDLGLVAAIAKSVFLVLKNIINIAIYAVLQFILMLIVILTTLLFQIFFIQISEIVQIVVAVVFYPILDLVIFGIYLQSINQSINIPKETAYSFVEVFLRIFNKGLATLKSFISLKNVPYIAYAFLVYFIGFILGSEYSKGPLGDLFSIFYTLGKTSIAFQQYPLSLSSGIFAHNWQVSILTSLSGTLTFAWPAMNCFFNALILGLLYGLVPAKIFFIGVLPHGVIELPSFLLAVSSGLKLGYYIIVKRDEVDGVLRETVYLLVGLAPFFLIAALIEALITPQLLKLFSVKF